MANTITFNFGIEGFDADSLRLDAATLGAILSDYVCLGSGKDQLSYSDVIIRLDNDAVRGEDIEVKDMLGSGTGLFSALIYRNAPAADRDKFTYEDAVNTTDWTSTKIAGYCFMAYFYYLSQNQPLTNIATGAKFITDVLNLKESPKEIAERLFEGGIEKLPADWIKHIRVEGLAPEAKNRFALGVAGYRLLQAFLTIHCVDSAPANVKQLWVDIAAIVRIGPTWGFHPRFRSPGFITTFKSMNKTLEYQLKTYGKKDQLAAAIDNKVLFREPIADMRYADITSYTYDIMAGYATDIILA